MTQDHTQSCPIARVLNIFGDNWTWLIIREAFYGASRFKDFERNTGIAKNLLSSRLNLLVDRGIFEKVNIGERGTRFSYKLTPKGKALRTTLYAMLQWGNEHLYGEGEEAVVLRDKKTGKLVRKMSLISEEGQPLEAHEVQVEIGPCAEPEVIQKLERAHIAIEEKKRAAQS